MALTAYSMQGRYQDAAKALKNVWRGTASGISNPAHTRYNLAQAYLGSEAFGKAIR